MSATTQHRCMRLLSALGVVHNCQHLPISTESTNLGGGGGGEGASVLFFKMLIYLWNISTN